MYSEQMIKIAIEIYIREGLPPDAEDQLWILFLEEPGLYDYFDTQLHFLNLANDVKAGKEPSPFECESVSYKA